MQFNKREAVAYFESEYLPHIVEEHGNNYAVVREEFYNYTNVLCQDGLITEEQYNTWSNPY